MAINRVTGASESEVQMFGGTALLDDADKRYVRATEFINFIKSAWTQDRFSMKGEFFPTDNFELRLRPRNEKPPEMFTAANSEGGRRMVAETGDWWFLPYDRNITTTDELLRELEKSIADMRSRMKAVGRHIRFGFNPFVGFGENTQSALDASIARIIAHERNPDTAKIQRSMLPATLGGCMGKPKDIRRQIGRFRDMGIELILFKMTAGIDDVRRIGSEIIAPFRSGST
jgi:alkanesulfonate monooxygenase SsuD/methylene tetrahydromethanopterin reductase-like flavin-dependent oxidoreductase (luciferase family)